MNASHPGQTQSAQEPGAAGKGPAVSLAERVAGLSAAKRALLEQRLATSPVARSTVIRPRAPGEAVPMSFAQGRLWFVEQLSPGTHVWNSPLAWRLLGPVDDGCLSRSLATVVARHAPLRTVFAASGGRPTPVLLTDPVVTIATVDVRSLPAARRAQEVRWIVEAEVRRPFDIATDVLVRGRLVCVDDEEHVLVLTAHHIACDGWSKGILVAELAAAYNALRAGDQPRFPPLVVDYGDYAVWQREQLAGSEAARLAAHWHAALTPPAPPLALPLDRPRPPRQAFEGAVEPLSISADLVRRLDAVGRSAGATRFMAVLAAYSVLLSAHGAQDDIVIGAPAAMRSHPELEALIGFFANTLPYRIDLSGRPTFRELLARTRQAALATLAHQDLPFDQIVRTLRPRRDASRTPLVQVSLRVEGPEPELQLTGVRAQRLAIDPGIARFDLAIELADADGRLDGYLEYDTALFAQSSARGLARDFLAIIDAVIAAPDRDLADLDPVRRIASAARERT